MTDPLDRRGLVQAGLLGPGAAALAATLPTTTTLAQGAGPTPAVGAAGPPSGARRAPYTVKPLPFDPQRVRRMSERILVSHHENNYAGAVRRLNSIADQLASLDYERTPGFVVNGLKREELVAANSMILHELFFDGLGEESRPGAALAEALARDFGLLERWRAEFTAMGRAQGGGSGWVLLTWSPRERRLVNAWAADHTTTLAGGTPILALDMYEHAYHMDFGARAGGYVDAFMAAIRWANADRLYEPLSKA